VRFCSGCAAPLERRSVEGKMLPVCPRCGQVVYADPKVAAGTIIEDAGRVLLLRRAISPARGLWTFPGGYVDRGEPVDRAAVRETWEETGLRVRLERLHGVFSYPDVTVVLIVYTAAVTGGSLVAGDECEEAVWAQPAAIPWEELAFPSTADALRAWIEREGR
jgi:mutator protein MutT